ncbi:MAG: hypothetical protein AAFY42_05440, partial [Pseudomonadota bacterium]
MGFVRACASQDRPNAALSAKGVAIPVGGQPIKKDQKDRGGGLSGPCACARFRKPGEEREERGPVQKFIKG